MPKPLTPQPANDFTDDMSPELEQQLYARHAEIKSLEDLKPQRGTAVPAIFNHFYKFIQNPSTVSIETFKRMVDTDDTIGSGVDFLVTCLAARLGRYTHKSTEITEWVNQRLDEIEGGWVECVKEMLSASWAGFSCSEKVWANNDNGFVPSKIVTLPPSTILFEVDRAGTLTPDGILQYQRNYNPANFMQGAGYLFGFSNYALPTDTPVRPDPYAKLGDFAFPLRTANVYNYMSLRIPTQKCIHYAFNAQGRFRNPYGRSLLRRAYKFYVMKDAFLQMLAVALDRKGTPLTIVYADPNRTLKDPTKTTTGVNQRGQRNGIGADESAQRAFRNVHNDTTIILPGKKGEVYETDFVPQSANTNDFIEAIRMCDRGSMRAMLLPSLIFTGGDGSGSYSLGQEHAKTFDKILDSFLGGFRNVITQQLIREMIAYNFPESAWKKDGLGDFNKRELSQDEIQKELQCVETGVNIGAIDMNDLKDLNVIREKMGFEPRTKIIEKPEEDLEDDGGDPQGGDDK